MITIKNRETPDLWCHGKSVPDLPEHKRCVNSHALFFVTEGLLNNWN